MCKALNTPRPWPHHLTHWHCLHNHRFREFYGKRQRFENLCLQITFVQFQHLYQRWFALFCKNLSLIDWLFLQRFSTSLAIPEVRLTNVVSFSSEDPAFKAENLLTSSEVKKWRTLTEGESQLTAVLQMEKGGQISMIKIGNYGSAFVEIQVGRKGSIEQDGNFHVH